MSGSDYVKQKCREALEAAQSQMASLLERRELIDREITRLKGTCDQLSEFLGIEPPHSQPRLPALADLAGLANDTAVDPGITRSIRQVLAASRVPLSAMEVRQALESLGRDMKEYANAGAVVHNTLSRLERQGEVIRVQNPAGQTVAYALRSNNALRNRVMSEGGMPNSHGKNLAEMLTETRVEARNVARNRTMLAQEKSFFETLQDVKEDQKKK